jgi:transmembrane sensor
MKTVPFLNPHDPIPDAMAEQAAAWLARRDRGLSPAEQDEYLQWLGADPRHTEAVTQHAAALERMMQLYEWQPAHDTEPNPDLFKPSPSAAALRWARTHRFWSAGLAAAAAVAVGFILWSPRSAPVPVAEAPKSYLHVNERLALPDGSRVELKDGAKLVVQYSENERRVKLTTGEAHFTVWKDKARPFIVDAAGIEVRAVGTAFNVRLEQKSVEVLVTEGRVAVDDTGVGAVAPNRPDGEAVEGNGPYREARQFFISQGERAVVARDDLATAPVVAPVTTEDISRELDWQAPRLQFNETPLADAVAEFNRLNRHQIVIADPELNSRRIGGTFRPDNVEGFVRMLGVAHDDIRAESATDGRTLLKRAP